MSPHYLATLQNAHRAGPTTELSEKPTKKLISPQPNLTDWNAVDYSMWKYRERRCTKHASLTRTYRRCH